MKQEIVNVAKKVIPNPVRIALRKLNWKRYEVQQRLFSPGPTHKVYCPIAEKEFDAFLKIKHELKTPSNGASRRMRLVWLYLTKELKILKHPVKVLHIAPELAYFPILKGAKNLAYHPGDKMVDGYSNQQGVQNIDLTALTFPDETFDVVICNHVLEHIPDDRQAMKEMFRALKSGGTGVITVPIDEQIASTYEDFSITSPKDRKQHFGQWDHVRFYGLDIESRLEEVGFEVEMCRYGATFSKEDYAKYGLCDDLIVVAKKP